MVENVKQDIVYSEVYEILQLLGANYINKLPDKLYKEITKKRKISYLPKFIIKGKEIDESKISKDAVAILGFLNLKYFVDNEEEKKRIKEIWKADEKKN